METQKNILQHKVLHILLWITFLVFATLLITSLTSLITPGKAYCEVYNDAYSYVDGFEDSSGLNPEETQGFEVSDGYLEAKEAPAVAVSECISLPQPENGTFLGWAFLKISLADPGTGSNSLDIRDCEGSSLTIINDLPEGESYIDLSAISDPAIRLVFTAGQAGTKVAFWNIYGTAEGATGIEVIPNMATVNSGDTVTFTIRLSASGALARKPVLRFSLDDINGLHTPAVDDGLAEDAEVDYGSGVNPYRPLEFVSATRGPKGELPATPETHATSGEVVWNLEDLNNGFLGNVAVTLRIPKGYINAKTLAARAVLEHGISAGAYTNKMGIEKTSGIVTVNSVATSYQSTYTPYGNVGPGATNIHETYYIGNIFSSDAHPSDIEDVTLTITGAGTCTPLFKSITAVCEHSYQIVSTPEVDYPITANDPVILHFDRASIHYDSILVNVYYDVPDDCTEGNKVGTSSEIAAGNPAWGDTGSRTHDVVFEVCRSGWGYAHRVMSGNDPGTYYQWPAWTEYYIYSNGCSLRAGEYFTTWAPYGDESYRTHTVTLDHTYVLVGIPEGITFHGIRNTGGLTRLYKDCTGNAPAPLDENFDHDLNPPHPAWKPVDTTWSGTPFSNPSDENDPEALVLPGCRLLGVKDTDSPAWQSPDHGNLHPHFLWRICDGSYGCSELPDGTSMSLVGGTLFTYETVTDTEGAVHECITYGCGRLYKEEKSWPKVYAWPEENQVPAGQTAHIIINPENQNFASQWVDGRWVLNLYNIREYIDLEMVTGEVLTEGFNIPKPDQNIMGETCNPEDAISFHFPDPEGCMEAVSEDDTACMAWWEAAPACQPPNGWGCPISGNYNHDNYVQMYRFRLNAPILNKTPANTVLDFIAEVRTNDLNLKGADNAVDTARWSAENYTAATSVTVLDLPGLDVEKAGPSARKLRDTITYTIETKNYGNTPNDGWYMVDWLPKEGENSCEFTPEYGRVYVDKLPEDVTVEYSEDMSCFTDPLAVIWTEISLQETDRTGYLAQTANLVNPNAACIRLRRKPNAETHLNPADTVLGAIDVVIPDGDISLYGKRLYNRALGGASTAFGAASDLSPVETVNVRTMVSSEVAVDIEKTFAIDTTRAGRVRWRLLVHNISGAVAGNISITDELPDDLIYKGIAGPLPPGWSLIEEPMGGETDGILSIMIDELDRDDGTPGTGNDEGFITFWCILKEGLPGGTIIKNCAQATPENGTEDNSCASIIVPYLDVNKTQNAIDRITTTPITDVFPNDTISYTITAKNLSGNAIFLKFYDGLDDQVEYVPNTFKVNGATAPDSFISNGILDYQYPDPVNPDDMIKLELSVRVKDTALHNSVIENTADISSCTGPLDPSSFFVTVQTPTVYNMVIQPCEGDFDKDGDVDGTDLAVFAHDFGRTDCREGDMDGPNASPLTSDCARMDCREDNLNSSDLPMLTSDCTRTIQQENLENEINLLKEEIECLKAENATLKLRVNGINEMR